MHLIGPKPQHNEINEARVKRWLDGKHINDDQIILNGNTYDIWRVLLNPPVYEWLMVPKRK